MTSVEAHKTMNTTSIPVPLTQEMTKKKIHVQVIVMM